MDYGDGDTEHYTITPRRATPAPCAAGRRGRRRRRGGGWPGCSSARRRAGRAPPASAGTLRRRTPRWRSPIREPSASAGSSPPLPVMTSTVLWPLAWAASRKARRRARASRWRRPVQIDASVDLYLAGGDLAGLAAIEFGERRRRARLGFGRCGDARLACGGRRLAARGVPAGWRWVGAGIGSDARRARQTTRGLALTGVEAARRVLPEPGLVRGDAAAATAGLPAGPAHGRAFSGAALPDASARAGVSFGSSTMNLPACLVTPARRPAASPEPK